MTLRFALASIVLLAMAGCGGGYSSTPTTPSGPVNGTAVSIVSGASVAPNPVVISAGGVVTWVNNDNTTHTSVADGGDWSSGNIAPGGQFSRTFPSAGSFTYHCSIHPGMVGTVTVQ